MKKLCLLLCSLLSLQALYAVDVRGIVRDAQGQPVSYASVYLENEPTIGTISDLNGTFQLAVPQPKQSTLVVSFIGYATQEIPLQNYRGDSLRFVLQEQPILLSETVINKALPAKKMKKKDKAALLAKVKARLDYDFPRENLRYHIVSNYAIYNPDTIVAFESLGGKLVELANVKKVNKKDSIQLKGDFCRRYRHPVAQRKFNYFTENQLKKKHKDMASLPDSLVKIHRTLWGGPMQQQFDDAMEHPSRWEFKDKGDKMQLIYVQSFNFIGIFSMRFTLTYEVDAYSYRMLHQTQELSLKANIPFGYKLDKEQLAFLNILNISENDLEKFRLKKVDAYAIRNVLLQEGEHRCFVREKNIDTRIKMADKNDRQMNVHITAAYKVLSAETGIRPYTQAELKQPVPITVSKTLE